MVYSEKIIIIIDLIGCLYATQQIVETSSDITFFTGLLMLLDASEEVGILISTYTILNDKKIQKIL